MAKVFYLSEIVQFAIEKEQQSYALYKQLFEQTNNSIFKELMVQEQQHETYYREMLGSLSQEQTPRVTENDEYIAYMSEMIAASRKIAPVTELDFNDLKSVYDYAIGREQDSILFYVGLKNLVPENKHQHIDVIIKEEGRHITKILQMKRGE